LRAVERRSTNSPARFTTAAWSNSLAQSPTVRPSHCTCRCGPGRGVLVRITTFSVALGSSFAVFSAAAWSVVRHPSAAGRLLNQDGDGSVGPAVTEGTSHLRHRCWISGDQPDQTSRHGSAPALRTRARDYLGELDPASAIVSPIYADLTGLSPLPIQAGSHEILLDDATRLAAKAAADNVAVILDITPEVPHVFQAFAGLLDEGHEALDRAAAFLRSHVGALA
jgi:acetyl esterase/lipase